MRLSIVIPVYNAAATIARLVDEVFVHCGSFLQEIILVNDCSSDNSADVCNMLAERYSNVIAISLRKNSGEHNAVMCGLNYVTGDCVAIMDDDFQNPPTEIYKLYEEIQKGYDVVYSRYEDKRHSFFRNAGSWFNNLIAGWLIDRPHGLYLSSFKIIHRDLVSEIIKYKGPFPYIDGLILRSTSSISTVTVHHANRTYGKSNYNMPRLVSLYLNMFVNFSIRPLRILIFMGLALFIVGVLLLIAFVIEKLSNPHIPIGWTAIATLIITFSGFQILFLGLMGEYVGKQYLDQNSTPQWVIKSVKKGSGYAE